MEYEDAISVVTNGETTETLDLEEATHVLNKQQLLINDAINFIVEFKEYDGAHHKDWVLDQIVQKLAGEKYDEIVTEAKNGEDGADTYSWDCGIAP